MEVDIQNYSPTVMFRIELGVHRCVPYSNNINY